MQELSPVVMVGYTRLETLRLSLLRLSECDSVVDRDVYLFLDAPYRKEDKSSSDKMLELALSMSKGSLSRMRVCRRMKNYGIPQNQIASITEVINKYGRVIFFEDDVCVSRTFLKYMDSALDLYEKDNRIFCINGFSPTYMKRPLADVFLLRRLSAWGVGIWADRWNKVDFDLRDFEEEIADPTLRKRVDSAGKDMYPMLRAIYDGTLKTWDAQCTYYMAKNGMFAVTPRLSLSKNIGYGVGLHCKGNAYLSSLRYYNYLPKLSADIVPDTGILQKYLSRPSGHFDRIRYFILKYLCAFSSRHLEPCEV